MTDTQHKILMWATRQLGVRESGGQNMGAPLKRYGRPPDGGAPRFGSPWCALFTMWVYQQAGTPIHRTNAQWWKAASVEYMITLMEKRAWDPQPGDVVAFDRRLASDAGKGWHCAIVDHVDKDSIVHTIDGNWGDSVARASHKLGNIAVVGYFTV